jgi:hypothetical protein
MYLSARDRLARVGVLGDIYLVVGRASTTAPNEPLKLITTRTCYRL